MKLTSAQCPSCGNPRLTLAPGQKRCQCEYCGSEFVVDWPDSGDPQISSLTTTSEETVRHYQFLAADRRLEYLKGSIKEAREAVEERKGLRDQAVAKYQSLASDLTRKLKNAKAAFWATATAAPVAWLLALLAAEGTPRYGLILTGAGAVVVGAMLYQRWGDAKQHLPTALSAARSEIDEAHDQMREARDRMKDLIVERDRCIETVTSYRYKEGNRSRRIRQ